MEKREFRTPKGRTVRLWCRPGTNDQMMAYSCLDEDEYGLKDVDLEDGLAADIGSHIGMIAIGLLVDNPHAVCVALEPIAQNVALIVQNAEENDVRHRLEVRHGAAAQKKGMVDIAWDFEGGDIASMHRFVGNQPMPDGTVQKTASVPGVTLADIIPAGTIRLLVTDCEGGEYALLGNTTATGWSTKGRVAEIRGEYHKGYSRLVSLLAKTHDVERLRGDDEVGGFVARLRA